MKVFLSRKADKALQQIPSEIRQHLEEKMRELSRAVVVECVALS